MCQASPHEVSADSLHVLVVDRDAAACRLGAEAAGRTPGVTLAGACADGAAAVATLESGRVDVVLLGVRPPDLDALGVLAALDPARRPAVVCSSPGPECALGAFEANAADYLLTPYGDARFAEAMARARRHLAATRAPRPPSAPPRYPEAIAVRCGPQFVVVRVADVDWVEADGNHARLHVDRRSRVVTKPLATLERDVLDPALFVRVHRSAIVNVSRVAAAEPLPHGELTLVLRDGSEVDCSRRYRRRLAGALYFTA